MTIRCQQQGVGYLGVGKVCLEGARVSGGRVCP